MRGLLVSLIYIVSYSLMPAQDGSFYRHLEGTIGSKVPMTMELHFDGSAFYGSCVIEGDSFPYHFGGGYRENSIELNCTRNGLLAGTFTGSFIATDIFSGTFTSPEGTRKFTLVENTQLPFTQSLPLEIYSLRDSVMTPPYGQNTEPCKIRILTTMLMPLPSAGNVSVSIAQEISSWFFETRASGAEKYAEARLAAIKDDLVNGPFKGTRCHNVYGGLHISNRMEVRLNKAGFFCVGEHQAESNNSWYYDNDYRFRVFDLQSGSEIHFFDIMGHDAQKLDSLADLLYARAVESGKEKGYADLRKTFRENMHRTGSAWFITPAGVGFQYNHGFLTKVNDAFFVELTWKEIAPLLKEGHPFARFTESSK